MSLNTLFYLAKPFLPRSVQLYLRKKRIEYLWGQCRDRWPIDESAGVTPPAWQEWPEGKRFALVLTHDVEKQKGQDKCSSLVRLEEGLGFRSSFNFVPQRYCVSPALRAYLFERGFEVGVHDLNHDGKLFSSRKIFYSRAPLINRYLKEWNSVGFRAGAMHHNLDWISELDLHYDCSTFDTDPFEPQPDAIGTIFPFWVKSGSSRGGYAELPYTLAQDFTLFILMRNTSIDIWKKKLDWIAQKGGMALVNTHPDYMNFGGAQGGGPEQYPAQYYRDFLHYVISRYEGEYWNGLPREVASLVRSNYLEMATTHRRVNYDREVHK